MLGCLLPFPTITVGSLEAWCQINFTGSAQFDVSGLKLDRKRFWLRTLGTDSVLRELFLALRINWVHPDTQSWVAYFSWRYFVNGRSSVISQIDLIVLRATTYQSAYRRLATKKDNAVRAASLKITSGKHTRLLARLVCALALPELHDVMLLSLKLKVYIFERKQIYVASRKQVFILNLRGRSS